MVELSPLQIQRRFTAAARADETPKSYAAFLAYVALGARRSVREAARQYHVNATSTGEISGLVRTTIHTWLGWSSKHKWVSRANARDTWLARVTDEQILANVKACQLAITTRAHDFLTSTDSEVFLRGARAFTLQHPPVQRVEDVSERIEDQRDSKVTEIEHYSSFLAGARSNSARSWSRSRNIEALPKPGHGHRVGLADAVTMILLRFAEPSAESSVLARA